MKAYKCQGKGVAKVVETTAVALNPTDWKHIDFLPAEGATVGCDYVGVVEEVGAGVHKPFGKGDRVAGFAHGVNSVQPDDGTFAEYAVVKADVAMKVPPGLGDEDAATLGVGVSTVGQALYQTLGLPLPNSPSEKRPTVLIYGGRHLNDGLPRISTSTGLFALQYAKLSGFSVVTTCSPSNFDLVKEYGADKAFDYNDPNCGLAIRDFTLDSLQYALDTISSKDTAKICADALSSKGGAKYTNLLSPDNILPRNDVEFGWTLAYTAIGEDFKFHGGKSMPASPEDLAFSGKFWTITEGLFADGKLRAPPVDVRQGGLEGIAEGLQDLKNGKVSGRKMVYRISSG